MTINREDREEIIRKLRDSNTVTRSAPITISEQDRTVNAVIASEAPAVVYDYGRGEYIYEVLLMDGVDIPGKKQVPLLDNHNRWDGSKSVKGSLKNFSTTNGEMRADVQFSKLAEDEWTLVKEGHLTDLSVGYSVDKSRSVYIDPRARATVNGREFVNESAYTMAVRTYWKLKETSITPIGADENAKFRSDNQTHKEGIMPEEKKTEGTPAAAPQNEQRAEPAAPATPATDIEKIKEAARKEAAEAERARCAEIDNLGRSLSLDGEFVKGLRDGGLPIEECRKLAIDEHAKSLTPAGKGKDMIVTHDETDKKREGMVNGLLCRTGYRFGKDEQNIPRDVAKSEYRGASIMSCARSALIENGVPAARVASMSNDQVAHAILDDLRRGFAQGTADFTYALAASANKFLQKAYQETPTTYQAWTGTGTFQDFKVNNLVNTSGFSDLDLMVEGANFNFGKISEKQEQGQVYLYGKAYSIPFQAMVNDDLNIFSRIPAAMGAAVARKINRAVYTLLYGASGTGPDMKEDSNKMIDSTNHGNLGTAGVPSATTLTEMRKLMRKIKLKAPDLNSVTQYTNAELRYVVAPAAYETTLKTLVGSEFVAGDAGQQINTFRGSFVPVIDPILDELDTNAAPHWWGLADPNQFPVISVYKLAGYETPTIRSDSGRAGEALGMVWDISYAFGVVAEDWRGVVKNAGH